jgi:hypothetical protein
VIIFGSLTSMRFAQELGLEDVLLCFDADVDESWFPLLPSAMRISARIKQRLTLHWWKIPPRKFSHHLRAVLP